MFNFSTYINFEFTQPGIYDATKLGKTGQTRSNPIKEHSTIAFLLKTARN